MNTAALKSKLEGKLSLPSLPATIVELQRLLRDPGVGMKDLGQVVASDPPLTARVLRIANSAFYSLSVPVLDIGHAAAILGLDTLNTLLLQVGVLEFVESIDADSDFDPLDLWQHSVLTAQVASSMPSRLQRFTPSQELYVCGLLHDIGKFVLLDHLRDEFIACLKAAKTSGSLCDEERHAFGFTHADVGALVAERWGLPLKAVLAIGEHHDLDGSVQRDSLVAIVSLANHIAHELQGKKTPVLKQELPHQALKRLELDGDEIEVLLQRAIDFQCPAEAG